jgi:hypothetical protein
MVQGVIKYHVSGMLFSAAEKWLGEVKKDELLLQIQKKAVPLHRKTE